MTEARIGSLPWFAGVFWFATGGVLYGAAWGMMYTRDAVGWAVLRLSNGTEWCMRRATECAREAGATE